MKEINLKKMEINELKALAFDIDNDIKIKQAQFSQVVKELQEKVNLESKEVKK